MLPSSPFIHSSIIAFIATVALGRSSDLQAIGPEEQAVQAAQAKVAITGAPAPAALAQGESRVDQLQINSNLVPSSTHPSRLAIELNVHNPTEHEIVTDCELALERYSGETMSRVGPAPVAVWRHKEPLELVAGATITRQIELPAGLSAQVQNARKAAQRAEAAGQVPRRYLAYEVIAAPMSKSGRAIVSQPLPIASGSAPAPAPAPVAAQAMPRPKVSALGY